MPVYRPTNARKTYGALLEKTEHRGLSTETDGAGKRIKSRLVMRGARPHVEAWQVDRNGVPTGEEFLWIPDYDPQEDERPDDLTMWVSGTTVGFWLGTHGKTYDTRPA